MYLRQVAKKAFEALASRSLRGVSEVLSERYKGDAQVFNLISRPNVLARTKPQQLASWKNPI